MAAGDTSELQLSPEQEAIRAKCFHPTRTYVEFPPEEVETSIPLRFEKIVRRYADRIAIKTETGAVTYKQLNDMANRFAHVLLQRQGPKAQLVGILLEKDVAQVAAMLGVMKAGKFFLILDPSFPKARLSAMLKQARAKLGVTNRQNTLLANEITNGDCQWMEWETIHESISGDNPGITIVPKALAFINYTSGSTGEPKGLLRTHRMILHNIMLRTNLIHVCEHDRISLLSSGTSNAITNSLLALLNGAGLYSLEVKKAGVVRLRAWLAEEHITIAPMSSPLFRGLCETLKGNNHFPDLRVVRLRSESVFRADTHLYKRSFSSNCILVTGLSSNETGPLADYLIDHDTILNESAVPVGYPAPGKEIMLLDQDGKKIGFDEVGEIAVRSRYLSPGYLRNPRLGKAKFKRDANENGYRFYLTGDMGLRLADGCLIHKGRKDFRVKVRGYPVDLKEVEMALRAHPNIRDTVVTPRSTRSGEMALTAYFVTASEQAPTISELVRFLARTLPGYMIPPAFVRLESIPLTPHNKVDRAALPLPAETRPQVDSPFMAPRCEVERQLAEIWADVLGIDCVGIHDNFLDLGGHSLAGTRIISRVIDKFQLELPLQSLFDAPTVEKMAAVITENHGLDVKPGEFPSRPSSGVVQVRPVGPSSDFQPFPKEDVEQSIPERFEKMVRMYPDRTAVKMGPEVVTYSQVNATANRLAHSIIARRGFEPEAVAILLEKGPKLLTAMLAVLKAGKFIVLLDRSSPKARVAAVLEDSQAGLIISERQNSEVIRDCGETDSRVLEFDSIGSHVPTENLGLNISPDTLAILNYTSGSTGEPKGVIWAHRNLLHQVMLFTNAYALSKYDRLLLTTSGTGNAVTIGFLALLNGATILPFEVQIHGVKRLVKWIRDEGISICWIGAPLFRSLCLALSGDERFRDVRILRLASEASYKSDIELYRKHFSPECLLINGLSSTESGLVCLYPVDFRTELFGSEVPVGYPVEDKECLLLDDFGKEVGVNEVGEIAIRSRYLSPGYWHRPELTKDKFKPDPSGGDRRIYLSGDLGLKLPDGCLVHKGRKDFRVKVRGYGVEPAEIEKVLNNHGAVKQAVVVGREKESGEARLVAYYTCAGLLSPTVSELRNFLRTELPDFMIPSAFVMLEEMPLTHSGKVDRRALPEATNLRPELAAPYSSPRNDFEQKLAAIWEEVLDVRPVGINDNFLDLGGDSLSASRVIAQVSDRFQLEISFELLLQLSTIANIASLVAQHQGQLSENHKPHHLGGRAVAPTSRQQLFPLSYSQQRLWFLDQLDPGGFGYNLFSAYRLEGELNIAALEQSFNEIVRRHEVLRTVFKSNGGNPVQAILPNLTIRIPIFDLRGIDSEEDKWAELRRISREEAQRPFDLASGPLLRITLVRLADNEHVLLRAMHHIVSDGWSEGVLFRELAKVYDALSNGKPSPLPDLPVQYRDYAVWQRQSLQTDRLLSQLAYWRKQLESITTLQLPTDRPRPAILTPHGARKYFALSRTLSAELKELSHRHGVTLFMTLMAAFQTLLHRYTGQTDIVVGSPVAGRSRKEFEELIGFFLNMLVFRLDLSGNPTFAEAIDRMRRVCLAALSHQELPFEKLVEELHPDRVLRQNPLFQVSFAFQNTPRFLPQLFNIKVDELEVETGIARFDLHLFIEEIDGHLKGYCVYDTNLFNADTIERLLGSFQTLLESVAKNPEKRVIDIPVLTEAEKHQLLIEWNDTQRDYPRHRSVHELFEAAAERTPDRVAVVFEDEHLTYRELNTRANRLAHYLRKQGVGTEVVVGVCMERSLEMVVTLLGILKIGGVYLPLDPAYPKERLAFMLEDARTHLVLTQQKMWKKVIEDGKSKSLASDSRSAIFDQQLQVVCVDSGWATIAQESEANPANIVSPDNLVYVMYTSGSTGTPKGVGITHRGVTRLVQEQSYAELTESEVFLQFAPLSFDASTFEIWACLLNGGKLVISSADARSPNDLAELINSAHITTLWLTSALFHLMVDEHLESLRGVKQLIAGGDVLSAPLVKRVLDELPGCRLINGYGPTENTTFSCCHPISSAEQVGDSLPIGRPISNTQVYILDDHLNPVPRGVRGELYLGGDGLARGYLNRPELTAEKFIPNRFSEEPGARLYKTGDLARYLSDGNIEFLGRIDHQVKIRGFRIELGEIEAVLKEHAAVRDAVVVAREDVAGDKRLVGYVVNREPVQVSELRNYLQAKLPDYMVPSALVFLDFLPLTPNGKIDRRTLPRPDQSRPELEDEFVAPRTPTEELLAEKWSEVLKVERVGVHDNFFALGGHSLLATQVISRLREAFGIALPLRSLFERPTVAGLAEQIDTLLWAGEKYRPSVNESQEREETEL